MSIVTIRGQMGAGAIDVAKRVAETIHADYVDREILARVASNLQRQEQDVEAKELPPATLLGRIEEALTVAAAYGAGDAMVPVFAPVWRAPLNDEIYIKALESAVKNLARGGSLVIRGRGSQFVLKDYPATLHVLLVAPLGMRTKRIMKILGMDEESASREIAKFDNSRREFARRYFKADLEDPVNYDMVLNTGRISNEEAASIIADAVGIAKAAQEDV